MPTIRTTFLIDGFNLYHSVVSASKDLGGAQTKWLDIKSFCQSYLHLFGKDHRMEDIYYFSAIATHRELHSPGITKKQQDFIDCLASTGIKVTLGVFFSKDLYCTTCGDLLTHHEEKKTDVGIASKLIEILISDSCDAVIIVSGDTDLIPAVELCKRIFPKKQVNFLFPYRRKNKEIVKLCPHSVKISKEQYGKYQFPNPMILPDGRVMNMPLRWSASPRMGLQWYQKKQLSVLIPIRELIRVIAKSLNRKIVHLKRSDV